MNIEKEEQEEFITQAKNQLLEDTLNECEASREIMRILSNRMTLNLYQSLAAI